MAIIALAKRKIEVIVLQLGKLDLAPLAGKLMLFMLAAVAEMERDLLVERTQSGLAGAKSDGRYLVDRQRQPSVNGTKSVIL